jgi:hypothetical protein
MRYNKYAMPVHPKILERDYETEDKILTDLDKLTKKLEKIDSLDSYDKNLTLLLTGLNKFLHKTWFLVNEKRGINLRDREKLEPLFKEINRLFGGDYIYSGTLYRGVRLSSILGPTDLTDTYPHGMKNKAVVQHLESLAYGLRSWTKNQNQAISWARSTYSGGNDDDRDLVIFEIENPKVILDADPLIQYYEEDYLGDITKPMIDDEEVILNLKKPKILNISYDESGYYSHQNRFFVTIKDR